MPLRRLTADDKCSHCGSPCSGNLAPQTAEVIYCARHAYLVAAAIAAYHPKELASEQKRIELLFDQAVRCIAEAVHAEPGLSPARAGYRDYVRATIDPLLKSLRVLAPAIEISRVSQAHIKRMRRGFGSNRAEFCAFYVLTQAALWNVRRPSEKFTLRDIAATMIYASKHDPNGALFSLEWRGDVMDRVEKLKTRWAAAKKKAAKEARPAATAKGELDPPKPA